MSAAPVGTGQQIGGNSEAWTIGPSQHAMIPAGSSGQTISAARGAADELTTAG